VIKEMKKVPKKDREIVGKILKENRMAKNMSLKDLGDRIKMAPGNLSRVENGQISISYEKLTLVAIILDVPQVFTIAGLPLPDYFDHKYKRSPSLFPDLTDISDVNSEDPFEKYNRIKPSSYFENNKIDLYEQTQALYDNNLGRYCNMLSSNPWARTLFLDNLLIFRNAQSDNENVLHNLKLALNKLDNKFFEKELILSELDTVNSGPNYWEGYLEGIQENVILLSRVLKNDGLYWFLAGFLSPEDAFLLDKFYDAFKDLTSENKESLADAINGLIELYSVLNRTKLESLKHKKK